MTTEYPTAAALAAAMKAEISDLIKAGTIPESVASFSELHDYIDANMLGEDLFPELDDDDETGEQLDRWVDVFNPASSEVSAWLKEGRP
jgi:hypothetical protein